MTVKDAASLWGISERRVNELCRSGRIMGAEQDGRKWLIPDDAQKPADMRGRPNTPRKPLPIGVSDYKDACTDYYYVDKTMMLKDFMDERPKVSLFTRPRRFGKTLNMDMFRTYFEKADADTSIYFRDKKIWKCGDRYRSQQGKYPVVFLSFKDIKYATWEETYQAIKQLIAQEFRRHNLLAASNTLSDYERNDFPKTGYRCRERSRLSDVSTNAYIASA